MLSELFIIFQWNLFFSETYLDGTSSLWNVMRLDCCVPVQSIKVENGCDVSLITNEAEYYA